MTFKQQDSKAKAITPADDSNKPVDEVKKEEEVKKPSTPESK